MATKKPTDLEDIADAITGLAALMDKRFEQVDKHFEQVDKRFDQVDRRFDRIEKEQHEMRTWLERIDNRLLGIESDITEIYGRIVALEAKGSSLTKKDKQELERQIAALFKWAKQVSKQTGIALPRL